MEQVKSDLNQESLLSQQTLPKSQQPSKQIKPHEFELTPLQNLISKVGGQGRYQFWSFMIFNAMWFLTSWTLMGMGYFFDDRFQCFDDIKKEQCQTYICGLSQSQRPLALKWHANSIIFAYQQQYFICENAYLKPILVSLIYIGSFIGFLIIPYIADNFGRKIAINLSWGLFAVGILFIAIADAPHLIGIGQFLTGFGCNPAITLCYSFLNEQVLGSKRQYYGVIIQVVLAFGECTIALVFLPDYSWKVVCYILLGLVLLILLSFRFLVQSPKFLISKSKRQTLDVLNQIAKINKRQPLELSQVQAIQVIDDEKAQGTSIVDLFKYRSLRMASIGGGFVFLAIQVIYYTTLLSLDDIGYTKFVNQQIVGLSEAFGYIAAEIFISRILRKKWSLIGMCVSSLMCFLLASFTIFQNQEIDSQIKIAQTISLIAGRFVLCAVWALFYVYIAELYPTKVRSLGLGFVSGVGTVGSTMAPYMLYYSSRAGINQWIIPGIIGLIGFTFIFCLRQTFKKPLYDDIEQVRIKGQWELSDQQDDKNPQPSKA